MSYLDELLAPAETLQMEPEKPLRWRRAAKMLGALAAGIERQCDRPIMRGLLVLFAVSLCLFWIGFIAIDAWTPAP